MKNAFGIEQGSHLGLAGSCIVCLEGTDTGLAFQGSPEWCIAGLMTLGVSQSEAVTTFESGHPEDIPEWLTVTYRVCVGCASQAEANFPRPTLLYVGADLPAITQGAMS